MAESEEELKSLLMKMKEESEKVGLKLNIQKMKIMASGPITSRELDRDSFHGIQEKFSASRIPCSPVGARIKATIFPVVMYGCESWTMKKAEHRRIDAFELWCWRRLESPLDCKEIQPVHPKGDQSWVLIGRTDVEAETPILWPPDAKS